MKQLYKYKLIMDEAEYMVVVDSLDHAIRLINKHHNEYGVPDDIEFIRLESIRVLTEEETK